MKPLIIALSLILAAIIAPTQDASADALADAYARGMTELREANYQAALPYFQQALAIARERFGDDDPRIALELNNLGETYRLLGQYDEAERLLKEALALDERSQNRNIGATATSLNNLALIAREKGDTGEALALYRQSLGLLEDAYGVNHPDVAKSLNNMAMLHLDQGEPDKAAPLAERALKIAGAALGTQHPVTTLIASNADRINTIIAQAGSAQPTEADRTTQTLRTLKQTGYAVHLASVRSAQSALDEWHRYLGIHPELGQIIQNEPEKISTKDKGDFFRVSGGAFASKEAAVKFCSLIKQKGQYCGVLPPD